MGGEEQEPVGAIFDTNSDGRYDLVVYDDGLLAIRGTYVGVVLRTAGGWSAGESYESKRLAGLLQSGRAQLIDHEPNFFVRRESITAVILRKRWYGHSLTLGLDGGTSRTFDWKPKLNNFGTRRDPPGVPRSRICSRAGSTLPPLPP